MKTLHPETIPGVTLDTTITEHFAQPLSANLTTQLSHLVASAETILEVAAAGQHSLLMTGPPGTGKSMLANRLPGILPDMNEVESLEVAAIQSICQSFRWKTFARDIYRCKGRIRDPFFERASRKARKVSDKRS